MYIYLRAENLAGAIWEFCLSWLHKRGKALGWNLNLYCPCQGNLQESALHLLRTQNFPLGLRRAVAVAESQSFSMMTTKPVWWAWACHAESGPSFPRKKKLKNWATKGVISSPLFHAMQERAGLLSPKAKTLLVWVFEACPRAKRTWKAGRPSYLLSLESAYTPELCVWMIEWTLHSQCHGMLL